MKTEKIVLSFIGILFGLLVAGVAFYLYQTTKTPPSEKKITVKKLTPTPTSIESSFFLNVDSPSDESVTDKKTISIAGKTIPNATVVVTGPSDDQVITPSTQGDFSTTTTIDDGQNQITITAIGPNGEEVKKIVTVTYSKEEF